MNPVELERHEIAPAVLAWKEQIPAGPERDRLQMGLYRTCIQLAGTLCEGGPDAEDLAHDFLIQLRQGHIGILESEAGLSTALRRFWNQSRDPAASELWETLSDALGSLGKEGKARRVDAPIGARNNNAAAWTVHNDAPAADHPSDLADFEKKAEKVRRVAPPREKRRDLNFTHKVISPKEAKELTLTLLRCGNGWITMGELFSIFKAKVHLRIWVAPDEGTLEQVPDDHVVECDDRLRCLATELAPRIWLQFKEKRLDGLFCGYFAPKNLRGEKAAMKGLGNTSTVFDKNKDVVRILRECLHPDGILDGDNSRWHSRLLLEVVEKLATFCESSSGKPPDQGLL